MRRGLGLLVGLALGLGGSQYPEYAQQYEQRLGGAVDELQAVVEKFDAAAASEGLTRGEALERYAHNPDEFIVGQGGDMQATIDRYQRLSAHLADLQTAGPLERLTDMARYYDPEIGARAAETYKPAVPVTPEGIGLGAGGLAVGYALVALLARPFRSRRSRIRVSRR